jgi:hypothetical protein
VPASAQRKSVRTGSVLHHEIRQPGPGDSRQRSETRLFATSTAIVLDFVLDSSFPVHTNDFGTPDADQVARGVHSIQDGPPFTMMPRRCANSAASKIRRAGF